MKTFSFDFSGSRVARGLILAMLSAGLPGCAWFQNPPAPDVSGPPEKPSTVMSPTSAPANADPHAVSSVPLP